jgi:hypothetical protein
MKECAVRVRLVRVSAEGPSEAPRDVTLHQRALPYKVGSSPKCDIVLLPPQHGVSHAGAPGEKTSPARGSCGVAPHHCSLAVDRFGNVKMTFPPTRPCGGVWINKLRANNDHNAVLSAGQSISFGDSPHHFLYRLLRCPVALDPNALSEPFEPAATKGEDAVVKRPPPPVLQPEDKNDEKIRPNELLVAPAEDGSPPPAESEASCLFSLALNWSRDLPEMISAVARGKLTNGPALPLSTHEPAAVSQDMADGLAVVAPSDPSTDITASVVTKLTTSCDGDDDDETATGTTVIASSPDSGLVPPSPPRQAAEFSTSSKSGISSSSISSQEVVIAHSYLRIDVGRGHTMCDLNGVHRLGATGGGSGSSPHATTASLSATSQHPVSPATAAHAHPMVTQRGQRRMLAQAKALRRADENKAELARFAQRTMTLLESRFAEKRDVFDHSSADLELLYCALTTLTAAASALFKAESSFLQLRSPIFCCGDIHGSFSDLLIIVRNMVPFGHPKYMATPILLLGDFVDRGPCSVEVVVYLMAWKVLCPNGIFLLRGNHEDPDVNGDISQYGPASFLSVCLNLFGVDRGQEGWRAANDCFQFLPLAAVIDKQIFACHGGIPRLSETPHTAKSPGDGVDDIKGSPHRAALSCSHFSQLLAGCLEAGSLKFRTLMPQTGDSEQQRSLRRLARELVWNDPAATASANSPTATVVGAATGPQFDAMGFRCNTGRGDTEELILEFSRAAVEAFFERFQLKLLIRAHQHKTYGVELSSGANVITLFSSCNYAGENAAGACLIHAGEVRLVAWRRDVPKRSTGLETMGSEWSSGMLPTLDLTEIPKQKVSAATATPNPLPAAVEVPPQTPHSPSSASPPSAKIAPVLVFAVATPEVVTPINTAISTGACGAHPAANMSSAPKVSPSRQAMSAAHLLRAAVDDLDEDSETPDDQSSAICG